MTGQNTRPQPSADDAMALWERADRAGEDAYVEAVLAGGQSADDAHKCGAIAAAAVIASALEAARREALAPRGAFAVTETVSGGQWSATLHFGPDAEAMQAFADAVRSALKENTNG